MSNEVVCSFPGKLSTESQLGADIIRGRLVSVPMASGKAGACRHGPRRAGPGGEAAEPGQAELVGQSKCRKKTQGPCLGCMAWSSAAPFLPQHYK